MKSIIIKAGITAFRVLTFVLVCQTIVQTAFAAATSSVIVNSSNPCGTGASFTFIYEDNNIGTTSSNAVTPVTITNIAKKSSYTITNIQAIFNGSAYTGPSSITGSTPANGNPITNVLDLVFSPV